MNLPKCPIKMDTPSSIWLHSWLLPPSYMTRVVLGCGRTTPQVVSGVSCPNYRGVKQHQVLEGKSKKSGKNKNSPDIKSDGCVEKRIFSLFDAPNAEHDRPPVSEKTAVPHIRTSAILEFGHFEKLEKFPSVQASIRTRSRVSRPAGSPCCTTLAPVPIGYTQGAAILEFGPPPAERPFCKNPLTDRLRPCPIPSSLHPPCVPQDPRVQLTI